MVFITRQLDYIFFISGMALIIAALMCFLLQKKQRFRLPWKWLAFFCLGFACTQWLDMIAVGLGSLYWLQIAQLVLTALSFILLVEFGRLGTVAAGGKAPGRSILVPMTAVAALGASYGMPGLNVSIRGVFGLTGGLWAGLVLLRSYRAEGRRRVYLCLSGATLILSATVFCLTGAVGVFSPGSNSAYLPAAYGLAAQLLGCLLVFFLDCFLLMDYVTTRTFRISARAEQYIVTTRILVLVAILAGGWITAQWVGNRQLKQQKTRLFDLAQRSVMAINPEYVSKLSASVQDLQNQDYRRLKAQLMTMQDNMPRARFIYLMTLVNGRVVFLVDSEPPGSKDESPPGQVYHEASKELINLFSSGTTLIEGPLPDQWGT